MMLMLTLCLSGRVPFPTGAGAAAWLSDRSAHFRADLPAQPVPYCRHWHDVHLAAVVALADAIAIVFVFPFILLFLGRFLLGETVGRDQIIACVLGFGGCLLVIKPSFAEVGVFALLPIAVAFAFSTFMLITRSIAKECDPISLQATSGTVSTAMLLLSGSLPEMTRPMIWRSSCRQPRGSAGCCLPSARLVLPGICA